ncbi:MAG: hypothetical protein EA426_02020 [Spirochaetaceae bacterium]|nr:MAG: hypothetical protein EA426_02020 [Spirochaetaceae bacterium]
MTEALYYTDQEITEFEAHVARIDTVESKFHVVLDKTAFYPEGGGQPADRGTIDGIAVEDVRKLDDIVHVLSRKPSGETVHGSVDWRHRWDYMQQHTAQHVISAALFAVGSIATVSVHLGEQYLTVETDSASISDETIENVVATVNRVIGENRPVRARWVDEAELASLDLRRPTKHTGLVRIVEIENFDRVGCGGVHAPSTGAVRIANCVGIEKIRGRVRTIWMAGDRAVDHYRLTAQITAALTELLSAKPPEIVGRVTATIDALKNAEYQVRGLTERLASAHARDLIERAEKTPTGTRVVAQELTDGKEYARSLAEAVAAESQTAACLVSRDEAGRVLWWIAASDDAGLDWTAVRRDLFPIIDAKGGGRPPVWQGVGEGDTTRFLRAFVELNQK